MDAEENPKRFPSAPTALGNRKLRDSHIPTAATKQWKSGKPKAGFPLSHCLRFSLYSQIQKGGLAAELRSFSRLIVRLENAHPPRVTSAAGCSRPPSGSITPSPPT